MPDIEKYSGLCIDGPFDGTRKDNERPTCQAFIKPATPVSLDFNASFDEVGETITKVEYQHVAFFLRNDIERTTVSVGFWISEPTKNPRLYVLERLAAAYETLAKLGGPK
jgi:hypothetical protein